MAITIQFAMTFATLLVEYEHFITLNHGREHFANNFCAFNGGNTNSDVAVVVNQQHFLKFNSLTAFCALNVVYKELLTLFNLELLTVNLYDCVHFINCINGFFREAFLFVRTLFSLVGL